jgi:hypothetical protein
MKKRRKREEKDRVSAKVREIPTDDLTGLAKC